MTKVFIDGSAGTTGLRIRERLACRADLEIASLPESLRKDPSARRDALNSADVAFLCLPDAAAVEAAAFVENPATVVIDTSTAHRTSEGWEYGFPELAGRRERIAAAKRIANPGCHATGFIALVEPLVRAGMLPAAASLSAFSLTGYSGGGKKMIADYEAAGASEGATPRALLAGGRQYALGQTHKHLPEMVKICGLEKAPVFSPVVVPHLSGMEVTVPLFAEQLSLSAGVSALDAVSSAYREAYRGGLVKFADDPSENGFLSSAALSGRDDLEVSVHGCADRLVLVARFDNLGKGASGAAIQNMNIAIGSHETEGLVTA
ncbi:MAG: N-acetyl-gamma-glutamyl-phosphate reductase [Kiritimatiellae bacterium]|nr:N-acetyl-gamma-glutamyl-phosphate reductase [Kiritimatiellia bacterium]